MDISLVRVTAARAGIVEIVQRNDNLILYTDVVTPAQMGAMMDAMPLHSVKSFAAVSEDKLRKLAETL